MRCTQVFDLPSAAIDFLKDNVRCIPSNFCKHCGQPNGEIVDRRVWQSAAHHGMFDDGPDLYEYILKDGRIVRECVQAVSWSSGPCIFLKLVDKDENVLFEWTQEEIDNA